MTLPSLILPLGGSGVASLLLAKGIWFIPFLVATVTYYHKITNDPEAPPVDRKELYKEYDFVIVGAGSAGAVLANRLSEIQGWNVLLLEAGGQETEISDTPLLASYLQLSPMDWQYKTEPQPGRACLGSNNKRCNWPRGKVMGGSSTLNYMIYVRGNKHDYDGWEALGNPGWGYKDALYYFKKSEDNRNPYLANTEYHSSGGYLTVQEPPWRTPLATAYVEGGVEMGFENRDINGQYQTGFMLMQGTIRRGSRCSTSKAFLRPIRRRRNLHIAMHAQATRILIAPNGGYEGSKPRAYGVRFKRDGKMYHVRARKEVIVSSGAINSPQLLMLSGIGPKDHLREMGIPLVQDLPVGQHLMDHYGTGALTWTVERPLTLVQTRYENIPSVLKYSMFGTGPLTSLGGVEALGFIPTKYANRSLDFPDIEFHIVSGHVGSDGGRSVRRVQAIGDEAWMKVWKELSFKDAFQIIPLLLRPKSVGNIRLRSRNPFHYPLINAGYFTHPEDIKVLVEGVKFALALAETQALQRFGARFHARVMPGCEDTVWWTDEYWECMCRVITTTIYHYSGTAKMGPPNDPGAVVDPELRVYGVDGLRVIDASIFPTIPSGNTNAPVIMTAEKGADLIKKYWHAYKHRKSRKRRRRKRRSAEEQRVKVQKEINKDLLLQMLLRSNRTLLRRELNISDSEQ